MAYRNDPDLEFFKDLSNEDLGTLVELLTKDKDGSTRWTESLTNSAEYEKYFPNHQAYWKNIVEEIQYFGGNSIASMFKGHGVLYREVASDVADHLKVKYEKNDTADQIEDKILVKLLGDAIDHMSEAERLKLAKEVGIELTQLNKQAMVAVFQTIFRLGGIQSYKLTAIVTNTVLQFMFGRSLSLAGNAALGRSISILTGPIGIALTVGWTLIDLAGPAYRVTLPVVVQTALLREKHKAEVEYLTEEIAKEFK